MPLRRQTFGERFVGGLGDAATELGGSMLKQGQTDRTNTMLTNRELLKDYTDKVMAGTLEPDQAEQALTSRGMKVPPGYFHTLQPSIEHELGKITGAMGKADTFQAVESPTALASEPVVKRLPLRLGKFDSPSQDFTGSAPTPGVEQPEGTDTSETPDQTLASTQMQQFSPEFNNLLNIRNEKLNSFPPKEVQGVDSNGVKNIQFPPSRPDLLTNRTFQTEASGAQAGRQASNKTLSETIGNSEGGLPELQGNMFTRTDNAERGAKAATAGATTTATRTAGEPFDRRAATFAHELSLSIPQLVTTNDPNTGEERPALVDKTGKTTPITLPDGQSYGKAKQIPPTIADNVAGANAAEIEAVKILRQLQATGLDKSNDPIDPRLNKFLINTLRMAPDDLTKADMQQRIGFVNATLTRALMGSRPSQYVAKEIIQPHLPQQNQTGMLLANTLKNVLQQVGERRNEFAHTIGVPIERLSPTNGTYAQYLRELGVETDAPANLTVDANGNLVPVKKQE